MPLNPPTSTPSKSHSSQPQGSSGVHQKELKRRMSKELSNQVWSFSPERIADMLCPSENPEPREDAINTAVEIFTTKLDSNPYTPSYTAPERDYYNFVAYILNACVASCLKVVTEHGIVPPGVDPLYALLRFITWGKPMADSVDGAEALQPDLAGINALSPDSPTQLYWSLAQENTHKRRIILPVEIKSHTPALVAQAATYARGLNSTAPLRAFELVLGYNYSCDEFRLFIFHRGGLTSSNAISLRGDSDRAALVRMFMSIMSWTDEGDAGYPSFTNGQQFIIPDPSNSTRSVSVTVDEVLYHAQGLRSRNTWVARLAHNTPTAGRNLRATTVAVRRRYQPNGDSQTPSRSTPPTPSTPRTQSSTGMATRLRSATKSTSTSTAPGM